MAKFIVVTPWELKVPSPVAINTDDIRQFSRAGNIPPAVRIFFKNGPDRQPLDVTETVEQLVTAANA